MIKNLFYIICSSIAGVVSAETKVLVDAVPTAAEFAGVTPLGLPFKDAEAEDPKKIEAGLNDAVAGILPTAGQQGFSYLCLLSAPGENPVQIPISAAHAKLGLSRKQTKVLVVFFRGGHPAENPITYSTAASDVKGAHVSVTVKKIALPEGGSTAGWVYFNLPRIQAEAEKAKSPKVFLSVDGSGPTTAVPIPGLKDPLMVPEGESAVTATWLMSAEMNATHKGEILGHPVPAGSPAKASSQP